MFFAFCIIYFTSIGQLNCERDFLFYSKAYDYIIQLQENKTKIIAISDSIIDLERYWDSPILEKYPAEKEKLNSFRKNKKYVWSEPYYCSCIDSLRTKKNKATPITHVLFFSPIDGNILLAELLPCFNTFIVNAKKIDCSFVSYENLSIFTSVNRYLFIFNNDGSINLFLKEKMNYE